MRARRESTAVTQKPGAPAGALGHSTNILQILTLVFLPRLLGCLVEFSFHVTAELNLILQPSLDVSHTKGFGPPPLGVCRGICVSRRVVVMRFASPCHSKEWSGKELLETA